MIWGKITGERIEYAPEVIELNGERKEVPEEMLRENGYKPVTRFTQECGEGQHIELSMSETETAILLVERAVPDEIDVPGEMPDENKITEV